MPIPLESARGDKFRGSDLSNEMTEEWGGRWWFYLLEQWDGGDRGMGKMGFKSLSHELILSTFYGIFIYLGSLQSPRQLSADPMPPCQVQVSLFLCDAKYLGDSFLAKENHSRLYRPSAWDRGGGVPESIIVCRYHIPIRSYRDLINKISLEACLVEGGACILEVRRREVAL